jgi:hypothetical protein
MISDPTLVIFGTPQVGNVLSAAQNTYQWYRSGVPIPGAISAYYTATRDDIGHIISVTRTAFSIMDGPIMDVLIIADGVLDFSQISNTMLIAAIAA